MNIYRLFIIILKNDYNEKIVLSSNNCWNIYNFRLGLVKKLIKKNYSVYIITKKDRYSEELIKLGCNLFFLNINRNSI